jgi:LmbE family N-acetylglucosaminyl deacetylase
MMKSDQKKRVDGDRRTITFLVAHPDDVAHAMSGTALLLKEQYDLHVFCLTKGERGIKGASDGEAAAIREQEERDACRLIGAEVTFLNQIDSEVFASETLCREIAEHFKRLRPVAHFTLWPVNIPDHIMAYTLSIKALQLADVFYETEIYMGENDIGGQTNQFEPDLYVNIENVCDQKREVVRCHKSQNPTEEHVEKVMIRNRLRGMMARCKYAEPFKTIMPITNDRWGRRSNTILLEL